jgi:hypothetical protein
VGTRDASGAALRWEAGAGAQTTRRGLRAVLSREAGTTPSPPLPRPSVGGQGMAPSRSGRRCLYLAATLLGLPPPPLHDFDDHLDLGYLIIKGLSSACGTRRFSTSVIAFASSRRCNCRGMSVHRILPLTYSSLSPSVVPLL